MGIHKAAAVLFLAAFTACRSVSISGEETGVTPVAPSPEGPAVIAPPPAPGAPITSIIVQEALPVGVPGLARDSAPVTVGIPLSESSGITSVSQLGLSGASAAQFRALAWWPNGNIRWVLVDFQTDLAAGKAREDIILTRGAGSFGGDPLATESSQAILVNTGSAQFSVAKSGFNLFDSVTVGGQSIVSSGNQGRIEALGLDGTTFSSRYHSATVSLESNGPVRAVVKATGSLKSEAGARLLDYTLRMYFYKGKSQVRGSLTLRNASAVAKTDIAFSHLEAIVPLSLGGEKTVMFSRKADVVTRAIGAGETAYLYQGYNSGIPVLQTKDCYYWKPPIPLASCNSVFVPDSSFQGLAIQVGSESVNASGVESDWSQGYAGLRNSAGAGVVLARKFMPAYWPAGFEFKGTGEASIELYSKHNGSAPVGMALGRHDTHELMWDFHSEPKDGKEVLYALQYPLIARAPFEHYLRTKAIFGQEELVGSAEQAQFFSEVRPSKPAPAYLTTNPGISVYRSWQWSKPGGDNQVDKSLSQLIDYLRTGLGGWYLLGEQRSIWNLETSVGLADDFDGFDPGDPSHLHPYQALGGTWLGLRRGWFDGEHAHFTSQPLYYFMSGEENIKEGYLAAGATFKRRNAAGYYATPNTTYLRGMLWTLRNLAYAYEFSCQVGACDSSLGTTVQNAVSTILDTRDIPSQGWGTNGTPHGRNLDRGYLWWETNAGEQSATSTPPTRLMHSFYHTDILPEVLFQVWRVLRDTRSAFSRTNDLEDFMTGLSQFLFYEYVQPVSRAGSGYYFYGYDVDYPWAFLKEYAVDFVQSDPSWQPKAQPSGGVSGDKERLRVGNASRAALWGYLRTGDPSFLTKGSGLLWSVQTEVGCTEYPSELQAQALQWAYLNKESVSVWKSLPLTVTKSGTGAYTLQWTVPTGAQELRIKYSRKPIVDWLGFDKVARTYQFDPAQYAPFFAATNIQANPAPAAAGTTQTFQVNGLSAEGEWYFSAKVLKQ